MGIKVAKFGGSSVADGIQMAKMREIIESDVDRKYIIVSAPGKRFPTDTKITDLLYLCMNQKEANITYEQVFQVIQDRFNAMKMNLGLDVDLTRHFDEIRENLDKGASEDYIVSRGEYLSAVVTAAYLDYDFVDTKGLILFDKRGRLDIDATDAALSAELANHERAIIPGFYGSNIEDGEIKVFSRSGSDISGALVARAVGADVYENWTDVPGFLMADPNIVDNPKPIRSISYMELQELSYMGATVIHEDAVNPLVSVNIPINIRNTNDPENPGTMITAENEKDDDRIITGIAGSKDFTVITVYKSGLNKEKGFVRKFLSIIEDNEISFEHLPTGIDTVSIIITNEQLGHSLEDILEEIELRLKPDVVEVHDNISMIAVVGERMSHRTGVSATVFTALAKEGINVRTIDQSTREMNIIIGVGTEDFEKAVRVLYEAFNG